MTDTPSRRPGLRDELVAALGQIDIIPPVAHRRQQADNVLTLLYREWPWLRAEAEDLAEARQHAAAIAAQRDRLRQRMNALADRWDHALAPDKAYARTLRAEISVAPFHAAPTAEDEAVDGAPAPGYTIGGQPATITDPAWLRQQYAAAIDEGFRTFDADKTEDAYLIEHLVDAVAAVPNRHLLQLQQRLRLADAELRQYTEAESADAAAGSYAGRAGAAEAFIAFVADTIADHEGDEWADHSATRAIRAAITRAVEPPGPAATQATDGLYDKITATFSGPLPPPGDIPPSVVLRCNHAWLRDPHQPHRWEPQPGMRPVQCPGYARVAVETDTTTKEI